MSRGRLLFLGLSLLTVGSLVAGGFGRPAWAEDDGEDSLYRYLSVFTEVLKLSRTVYVEELDLRPLMAGALDGVADALDPFSAYVPQGALESYDEARAVGRGRSGLLLLRDRGIVFVAALDSGSPADDLGLRRGDVVSKVDGRSTRDMPTWQLYETLAGPVGTEVLLEVVRSGEPVEMTLALAEFPAAAPSLREVDGFQVLRVPSIDEAAVARVGRLLQDVPESAQLVLDLRGTADQRPAAGLALADLFVDGPLAQWIVRGEVVREEASSRAQAGPSSLAVLTDRGAMGAAEVVAGAIQQNERGVIVGERTFGHTGQTKRVRLSTGDVLELTDGYFVASSALEPGDPIEPDLEVESRHFRLLGDDTGDSDGSEGSEGGEGSEDADADSEKDDAGRQRDERVLTEALELLRSHWGVEAAAA